MKPVRLAVYACVGIAMAAVCAAVQLSNSSDINAVTLICNACTVPGVVLTGIGGLMWTASLGAFDMIGYGVKGITAVFGKSGAREDYYTYVTRKSERRPSYTEVLAAGAVFLLTAAVLCVFYLAKQ